jgi:hypothetical protein
VLGTLGGTTVLAAGSFSGGQATATGLTYSEVGSLHLQASTSDYLGAGLTLSGQSGRVGRFYPAYFQLGSPLLLAACNDFTYMGQPQLGVAYTLQAQRSGGGLTTNYASAHYTTGSVSVEAENANDGVERAGRLSGSLTATWVGGQSQVDTPNVTFARAAAPDGPYDSLMIGVRVNDPDGALLSGRDMNAATGGTCTAGNTCTARSLGTTRVRYGRLELRNAHGPEVAALTVPLFATYYINNAFERHTSDVCTEVEADDVVLSNAQQIDQSDGTIFVGAGSTTLTVLHQPPVAGALDLRLSAPGAGHTGFVNLSVDLGAGGAGRPWLRYDWDANLSTAETDPGARATFGVYRGNPQVIDRRGNF